MLEFKLQNLPTDSGVYQFKDNTGKVIYVGKAKNLRSRVRSYFQSQQDHTDKTKRLVSKITDVEIIITTSEVEALILENNLIKQFKPRYNINLKDDKSFPYICITNEPFPRVLVTRYIIRNGSKYFGPYTQARQMRMALDTIAQIFQVRSCSLHLTTESIENKKFQVCLDYHIHKCQAPCVGYQSHENYNEMIEEIKKFLKGKTKDVISSVETKMKACAKELKFKEAQLYKIQLYALENFSSRQKIISVDEFDRDVFAVATTNEDGCGVVFKIRDGIMIGSSHYYFSNVENEMIDTILSRLLEKYYAESMDNSPNEIFLQAEISDETKQSLLGLLQKKIESEEDGNKKITIVVPQIGEKEKLVSMCKTNAEHLLNEYVMQKKVRGEAMAIPNVVYSLQRDLRLRELPRRIECFDNSNFQGSDAVAGMVSFEDGKPKKSEYRKFKIKTVEGIDDFASMAEVIERRYSGSLSKELSMPDLIIVDGGKGQLSSAVEVLQKLNLTIPIIGLAKKLEEVFFPNESLPFNLPKSSSSLKLLQQIRDETHRFAITFHRERRSKRILHTELVEIVGIGEKTAQKLITQFGSVETIKSTEKVELEKHVSSSVAERILRKLNNE